MFGLTADFGVPRVVLTEGAEGREKRVDEATGERCSTDESEDVESTENRECC